MVNRQPKRKSREGVDNYGRTPMHYAASETDTTRLYDLLKLGEDCNHQDDDGWAPLHFAAQSQSHQAIKALLATGALVDIQDNNGNTPLWRAVLAYNGDFSSITLLLSSGADAWRANKHGVSPFELGTDTDDPQLEGYFRAIHCA